MSLAVWRTPRVAFGILVVLALTIAAAGAPWLSPHDPLEQDLLNSFQAPRWAGGDAAHPLGTDSLGRDILSRLIYGARAALIVAFVAALFAGLLGTSLGLAAGYFGGRLDAAISRLVDVWMSFPSVLLCIVLAAVLGAGLHTVVIAIIIIDWTRFCRVVRAEVMVQKSHDYVASAMTIGLSVSSGVPTWGGIIQEGRLYVNQAWWLMALPMACIVVAVLGLNALGDGLRGALDPVKSG